MRLHRSPQDQNRIVRCLYTTLSLISCFLYSSLYLLLQWVMTCSFPGKDTDLFSPLPDFLLLLLLGYLIWAGCCEYLDL